MPGHAEPACSVQHVAAHSGAWLSVAECFTVLLICLFSQLSVADDEVESEVLGPPVTGQFDSLTEQIFPSSAHHLSDQISFTDYYKWKRKLSSRYGIDFALLNTPILQVGSGNGSGNSKAYLDNEMDFYFQWRAFENEQTSAKLFFWGLWVQTFSNLPSAAYSRSQGLFSLPNGGATDPGTSDIAPSALWWEQTFHQTGLTYRMGQLYAPSIWGSNHYLGDDRATFMNTVMATNQGSPWATGNRGLGAMATLSGEHFYASAGLQDASGDQQKIDFKSFADGEFVYLAELGVVPSQGAKYDSTYKLTVGYVDDTGKGRSAAEQSGWGLTLSARQDLGDDYGLFAIYRQSWGRYVNSSEAAAAAGVMWNRPFGWADDRLGVSAFYAKPHNDEELGLRNEYGLEAFWRFQLTPRVDITPDLQLYLQPGQKQQDSTVAVFGFRVRYVL